MRGLTREERELLRWLASTTDGVNEIEDSTLHDALADRGLVNTGTEIDEDGDECDTWTINETGRLALRVCT